MSDRENYCSPRIPRGLPRGMEGVLKRAAEAASSSNKTALALLADTPPLAAGIDE